jgi:TATA-box binding protein (TBP) (component of TFIID and TFIIIB)
MPAVEDYVARIEGTCGDEKGVVVTFKYDKKDEAIARISKKATLKKSIAGIITEFVFQDISFRVFSSGKAIFKGVKNREALQEILSALLL